MNHFGEQKLLQRIKAVPCTPDIKSSSALQKKEKKEKENSFERLYFTLMSC